MTYRGNVLSPSPWCGTEEAPSPDRALLLGLTVGPGKMHLRGTHSARRRRSERNAIVWLRRSAVTLTPALLMEQNVFDSQPPELSQEGRSRCTSRQRTPICFRDALESFSQVPTALDMAAALSIARLHFFGMSTKDRICAAQNLRLEKQQNGRC